MGRYIAIVVMRAVCPRCQSPAHAPTAWSSAWRCELHGEIQPLALARLPTVDGLRALVRQARVPVWLPWPLPPGWLVSGFTGAGDERTGTRASAVSLSGPNPLGGPADMLIIAEEPGVGLGAGLAGLPGPDPGDGFAASQPNATVEVGNHDAPLWLVESDGKAVFVGEVAANWVWLVLWPDTAGTLLLEPLPLRDLRDPDAGVRRAVRRAVAAPARNLRRHGATMAAVRIDLHVHSSASDGTDAPAEVVRRAAAAGLDVLALTDHDTQAGVAEARAALPPGLTLVPGMELSCQLDGRSVHLLCYLFDPDDPALRAETSQVRDDRVYRARAMTQRLRELGADVSWEQVTAIAGDAVVGRPHLARALAASGAIADPADAFTAEWIGDGGRAFVDRYAPWPGPRGGPGPRRGRRPGARPPPLARLRDPRRGHRGAGRRGPGRHRGLPPGPRRGRTVTG